MIKKKKKNRQSCLRPDPLKYLRVQDETHNKVSCSSKPTSWPTTQTWIFRVLSMFYSIYLFIYFFGWASALAWHSSSFLSKPDTGMDSGTLPPLQQEPPALVSKGILSDGAGLRADKILFKNFSTEWKSKVEVAEGRKRSRYAAPVCGCRVT